MAQHRQLDLELPRDAVQLLGGQPHGFPQLRRPIRAMQLEDRLTPRAHDMYVRRAVVTGENDDPIGSESEDGRNAEP